jgi:RHS repeat-associated protein
MKSIFSSRRGKRVPAPLRKTISRQDQQIEIRAAVGSIVESLESRILFGPLQNDRAQTPPIVPQSCNCCGCLGSIGENTFSGGPTQGDPGGTTEAPVVYFTGKPEYTSTDLSSNGIGGSFNWTRSWTGVNNGSSNGNSWVVAGQPYLVIVQNQYPGSGHDGIVMEVNTGASQRIFDVGSDSTTFTNRYWAQDTFAYTAPSTVGGRNLPGSFALTDTSGNTSTFYDLPRVTSGAGINLAVIGRLYGGSNWSRQVTSAHSDNAYPYGGFAGYTDAYGNSTTPTYDANGLMTNLVRTDQATGAQQEYLVAYTAYSNTNGASESLTSSVTLQHRAGTSAAWITDRSAAYVYYTGDTTGADAANGRLGDLKQVTIQDALGNTIDQKYYRYNKFFTATSSNADISINGVDTTGGSDTTYFDPANDVGVGVLVMSGLKSGIEGSFYSRLTAANGTALATLDGLTDAQVNAYANNSFVYERHSREDLEYSAYGSYYRVTTEKAAGNGCSSCAGGFGTYTLAYTNHTPSSASVLDGYFGGAIPGYSNSWAVKTVVTLPDGNKEIAYTNTIGEVLLKVNVDSTTNIMQGWAYQYDDDGRLVLSASPAALDLSGGLGSLELKDDLFGKSIGHYQYLRDSVGMIQRTDYYTQTDGGLTDGSSGTSNVSGGVYPYVRDHTVQQGQLDGAITVSSISSLGTITFPTDPGFNIGDEISVSGASDATYNGQFTLLTHPTSTTYTIQLSTTPSYDAIGTLKVVRPTLLDKRTYYSRNNGSGVYYYPLATFARYRNSDGTGAETTQFSYTWYPGTVAMKSRTTAKPGISATQHGPGATSPDTSTDYFDRFGRVVFHSDGGGYVNFTKYDVAGSGGIVKTIQDADTSVSADFIGGVSPTNFAGLSSIGTNLRGTMSATVDGLGRQTSVTDANGNATYLTYNDANHEVRIYKGWHAVGMSGTNALYNTTGPVLIQREHRPTGSNSVVVYQELLSATVLSHTGAPTGAEDFLSGGTAGGQIQTLSRDYTNNAGQTVQSDQYFNFGTNSYSVNPYFGIAGTNYASTSIGYDDRGRQDMTKSPNGTITHTTYEGFGRVASIWIGTNDQPGTNDAHWSPTNQGASSNLMKVQDNYYDTYDSQTPSSGDGNLTRTVQYPTGTNGVHVTENYYDWRDRQAATKSGLLLDSNNRFENSTNETDGVNRPITYYTYDNLGEVTQTDQYYGDGVSMTGTSHAVIAINGVPTTPTDSTRLRSRVTVSFDDQGRPFQTQTFDINQYGTSAGSLTTTNSLSSNLWYDHRGNVMASQQPGGLTTKSMFDGEGRLIKQYTTDGGQTNSGLGTLQSWSNAANVAGDIVLSQVESQYDYVGNPIRVVSRDRFHNDATNNATIIGLGDLQNSATNPMARVSYQSFYYDAGNRQTDSAFWGTLGGAGTSAISLTAPARSGTVLVSSIGYNSSGWIDTTTDAKGLVNKSYYDMMGRKTRTVSAFVDPGTNALQTFSDHNQITDYTYDGTGHVLTQKAWVNNNGTNNVFQTTQWVYGITTSGGSGLNSNDILQKVQYPDTSAGTPGTLSQFIESYKYDALGEQTKKTQRTGSVHQYTYDSLGRMTSDNVITLGTGVNNTIRRLDYSFDTGGRLYTATSYAGTTTATIVNQVMRIYNGLGQVTQEYQSHTGAVVTSGTAATPSVQYTYNEMSGGANNSRLTGIIYPTGSRTVTYAYNGNSGLDNVISRLSALSQTLGSGTSAVTTTLENYDYLGTSTVVRVGHPQTGVDLTYERQTGDSNVVSDGGDIYTGLDRFGRVSDQNYLQTNSGTSLTATDRFQYGYDANSNVMFRKNLVSSVNSELYHSNGTNGYDSLNRLTNFQRGTLATGNTSISGSPGATRNWTLDAQGNWSANAAGLAYTVNAQNQYTTVGGSCSCCCCCCSGTGMTFSYDSDGNLTSRPAPAGSGATANDAFTYDAWDREVGFLRLLGGINNGDVVETTSNIDALGRRTQIVTTGIAPNVFGALAGLPTDDLYYSISWQVLEDDNSMSATGGPNTGYNQMQFVWSPTYVNDLVLRDRSTAGNGTFNERIYVQHDANHNVTAITNSGSGTSLAVLERFIYDPYGGATVLSSTWANATDGYNWQYMFQGGRYDSNSGLYSFQRREYDPVLGRWIEQDSSGYADGANLNQFVGGNPIDYVDATGLVGEGAHHWIPKYLGGADDGIMTWLDSSQHNLAHDFWADHGFGGPNSGMNKKFINNLAKETFQELSACDQKALVRGSMKFAGMSDGFTAKELDNVMKQGWNGWIARNAAEEGALRNAIQGQMATAAETGIGAAAGKVARSGKWGGLAFTAMYEILFDVQKCGEGEDEALWHERYRAELDRKYRMDGNWWIRQTPTVPFPDFILPPAPPPGWHPPMAPWN